MTDTRFAGWFMLSVTIAVVAATFFVLVPLPAGIHAAALLSAVDIFNVLGAYLYITNRSDKKGPPRLLIACALSLDLLRLVAVLAYRYYQFSVTSSKVFTSLAVFLSLLFFIGLFATIAAAMAGLQQRIVKLVSAMLSKHLGDSVGHLITWYEQNRVLALLSVLALFLHIANMMTFAIAFDDERPSRRAIYPTTKADPFDVDPNTDVTSSSNALSISTRSRREDSTLHRRQTLVLLFSKGSAELQTAMTVWTKNHDYVCGNNNTLRRQKAMTQLSADLESAGKLVLSDDQTRTANINLDTVCKFASWTKNALKSSVSYRITVIGHSDPELIQDTLDEKVRKYKSNTELAQARADQAFIALARVINGAEPPPSNKPINASESGAGTDADPPSAQGAPGFCSKIGWLLVADSSEGLLLNDDESLWPSGPGTARFRSAEIQIEEIVAIGADEMTGAWAGGRVLPPRRLILMDYVYLMIYTMTTTGHGDLIPVSGNAKFIVSLANIMEVAFLTIVFNILVTERRCGYAAAFKDDSSGSQTVH